MLPYLYDYLKIPPLFGVLPIQPFGILVALGLVMGYYLARRRAEKIGLDSQLLADGLVWACVAGFAIAHWVSVIFYFPERVLKDPLSLLKFWAGLSSFGGFLGGILGCVLFFRRKKVSVQKYIDCALFGFVPGWILGRMGCTVVFDHPGLATDFVLGMMYKDGIVRHNLGMYEMLFTVGLTVVLYALKNVRPFDGFHPALVLLLYSPVRFGLDYLRETPVGGGDKRYLGLTPGQYFAVGMVLLAIFLIVKGLRAKRSTDPEPAPQPTKAKGKKKNST